MPRVTVGMAINSNPPLSRTRTFIRAAKAMRIDSVWAVDHWLGFFPVSIWDEDFSWMATKGSSPHAYFDWATLLGYAAKRAGNLQIGVGVTEPIRHHPVQLAQTAMTLSHMTKRPPILGIGSGEAENTVPYGLDFSTPVGRLEEALQIIRLCFESTGTFDFDGAHFKLDRAILDLRPKKGNEPKVWVAAHGPRMLRLTGRFADGWYPAIPMDPDAYLANLTTIRDAAIEAGRDPLGIVPGLSAFYVAAASTDEAREILDSSPMRFLALLAPHYVWERHGHSHPFGKEFRGLIDFIPQHYGREEMEAAMAKVPADVLSESVIWGTPGAVIEQFEALVAAGLRHVTISPVAAMISKAHAKYSLRATLKISRALHRM